jgi:hypothetical protein
LEETMARPVNPLFKNEQSKVRKPTRKPVWCAGLSDKKALIHWVYPVPGYPGTWFTYAYPESPGMGPHDLGPLCLNPASDEPHFFGKINNVMSMAIQCTFWNAFPEYRLGTYPWNTAQIEAIGHWLTFTRYCHHSSLFFNPRISLFGPPGCTRVSTTRHTRIPVETNDIMIIRRNNFFLTNRSVLVARWYHWKLLQTFPIFFCTNIYCFEN